MQIPRLFSATQYSSRDVHPAAELVFGIICGGGAILLRTLLDLWAPEISPFALVYPLILVGTLYGHCSAGLIAGAITFAWSWWQVVTPRGSFALGENMPALVSIHAASAVATLIFALAFRRAIYAALRARDLEITRGAMLMRELEHRTKNNFALVVSLLQAQKRQEGDPRITGALDLARARIHSFARAYANLAESQGEGGDVAMKTYLAEVVSHFADGGFPDNIRVSVRSCDCTLPREVAVGIGLFVNEALTNCAKHAFADHRPGHVQVTLQGSETEWELTIEDDGIGLAPPRDAQRNRGTGSRLMEAFAQQAHASFTLASSSSGTQARLASRAPSGSGTPD